MPVSSPESTMPIFLLLFLGSENCPAIGMKNCGITEQAPISSEAPQSIQTFCAAAITIAINAAMVILTRMSFLRESMSPKGMRKNKPSA
ncbi:Uncharacterised protein [Segatella copri]|nr:Uncharacterised protein [Segatella copri]